MANASVVLGWTMQQVWSTPVRDLNAVLLAKARSEGVPHQRSRTKMEDRLHESTMERYRKMNPEQVANVAKGG